MRNSLLLRGHLVETVGMNWQVLSVFGAFFWLTVEGQRWTVLRAVHVLCGKTSLFPQCFRGNRMNGFFRDDEQWKPNSALLKQPLRFWKSRY